MPRTTKKQTFEAMRADLIVCQGFTERGFNRMVEAMKRGDRIVACKEMRAIRQYGLRDALDHADKWMKEL